MAMEYEAMKESDEDAAERSLGQFLDRVRRELPELLIEVDAEIDPEFEITTFLRHLEDRGKYPGVLFTNVRNLAGEPGHRVFTNATADRRLIALAVGLAADQWEVELTKKFGEKAESRLEPVTIRRRRAPVKEVVKVGAEIDLRELPFIYHHEQDGGPYGTMEVVTKKPDDLGYNLAFHRTMYKEPRKTGILCAPQHTHRILKDYEERDEPAPVAIVHGHHPAFDLGSQYKSPWPWDEYEVPGGLMGTPLRLTPSETWGEEFLVPADAEIVIEGEVPPKVREPEGPFGEWTGYSDDYPDGREAEPIIEVTAVTHRTDYIWRDVDIGHADFSGIGWESEMYRRVNDALQGTVRGVHLPPSGCEGFHAYISIEKLSEGMPTIAACAAQTIGWPKLLIVVDDDINPYDEREVLWALATRFQADEDLDILGKISGSILDPSNPNPVAHNSVLIDATMPIEPDDPRVPFPPRVSVPQDVYDAMDLADFVAEETLNRIPEPKGV